MDIVPVPNGGISIEFRRADRIEIDVDAEGAFGVLEVRLRNGETHRKELQGLTMSEVLDALAAFREKEVGE